MTTQQPEALRLAEWLDHEYDQFGRMSACADELRRLHAESELHLQELRSYRITVENREARIFELEARVQELEDAQARMPLKLQQITDVVESVDFKTWGWLERLVRAIERAHCITQEKQG